MWGIDFYPTPSEVVAKMLGATDVSNKVILEPSAGSGNIVEYCKNSGAKEVIACEIDLNLRRILSHKCNIIESDFMQLTAERVSHIDMIVMNPPFSKQEEHVLHAWDIAPAGCQIISLCNNSMLSNSYISRREQIKELIKAYGNSENFGKCFDTAERKTNVDIGCLWLYKPGTGEDEFDGYFDLHDYEQDEINGSGIVRYDFVQDIVSRYIESVSMFDEVAASNKRINDSISGVTQNCNISFGAKWGRGDDYKDIDRQTFKKELQKAAWSRLFGMMKMDKYMTTGVKADINKFVEKQVHVPFTVKNVYLMVQMVAGTHSGRMDKVLCEAFDIICNYSYENSTAGDGWRTNSNFLINKRFILPHITEYSHFGGFRVHYDRGDKMNDVVKALCHLTGKNYEEQIEIYSWFNSGYRIMCDGRWCKSYEATGSKPDDYSIKRYYENLKAEGRDAHIMKIQREWGTWVDWNDFFVVKGFKKGTLHVEFKDEEIWRKFNQRVAEIRGWKNIVPPSKKGREKKSNNR